MDHWLEEPTLEGILCQLMCKLVVFCFEDIGNFNMPEFAFQVGDEFTWHEDNWGFDIKPVVGRDIFDVCNHWTIFLYQQRPDVNIVDGRSERF